ncbi:MAG: EamA/RhaT family transporter [Bacteroidota bacterium]
MIYLLLSILSSTSLFVIFKIVKKYEIKNFDIIIVNYIVASVLGFTISNYNNQIFPLYANSWFPYAVIIGILFVIGFVLIGLSSQKVGIAITTVASKMSVIIPITFSLVYDPYDQFTLLKVSGILLALLAVFLTVYRKRTIDFDPRYLYLPIILFIGMGTIDSIIKLAQFKHIDNGVSTLFSAVLFTIAAITAIATNIIRRSPFRRLLKPGTMLWGSLLGLGNYGSIWFLILALNSKTEKNLPIDGSAVFGINNIGIVGLSVMLGLIVFREKLTWINWTGIIFSFAAIYILSYTL